MDPADRNSGWFSLLSDPDSDGPGQLNRLVGDGNMNGDLVSLGSECPRRQPANLLTQQQRDGARSRHGARHRRNRRLCHLAPRAEQGRDAVRAPKAHPEARSAATTKTERRSRRVPPRSHCPEPSKTRKAHPDAGTPAGMRGRNPAHSLAIADAAPQPTFQRNPPTGDKPRIANFTSRCSPTTSLESAGLIFQSRPNRPVACNQRLIMGSGQLSPCSTFDLIGQNL